MPDSVLWPVFLAPMRAALEKIHPPEGPFDPAGAWTHRYSVLLLQPERGAKGEHPRPYGTLVLARQPRRSADFTLAVDLTIQTVGRSGMRNRATLTCVADRLATPRQWELHSDDLQDDQPVRGTSVVETAEWRDGTLIRKGRAERRTSLPGPFTSNWSLLEAVQRLPFDSKPLAFEMLEDLDLRKAEQSLRPVAPVTLELGGRAVKLRCFRQTGRGILPTHYWLDEQHRLVAITGALRGLVWAGAEERA